MALAGRLQVTPLLPSLHPRGEPDRLVPEAGMTRNRYLPVVTAAALLALSACSSSSSTTSASPTPSGNDPACDLETINGALFESDFPATSITCTTVDGTVWAGGELGAGADVLRASYVATAPVGGGWQLYAGDCRSVPDLIRPYCEAASGP